VQFLFTKYWREVRHFEQNPHVAVWRYIHLIYRTLPLPWYQAAWLRLRAPR
jgi:hypothetical protein